MRFAVLLLASACAFSATAIAQEIDGNRQPFNVERESGVYTTKQPSPAIRFYQPPQPMPQQMQQGQPMIQRQPVGPNGLPANVPFGRASSDALVPVPTGPRTTTAAPIPGVDMVEAGEPLPGDIIANELPDAVANPTKTTTQTGSIFEDEEAAPRPVEIRALNKVTGHATQMVLPPGSVETFGNLTIRAHLCRRAIENTQPDSAALLEVEEKKPEDERPNLLFSGWMFASSASLTSLEHPVYDLSVVGCKKPDNTADSSQKSTPSS